MDLWDFSSDEESIFSLFPPPRPPREKQNYGSPRDQRIAAVKGQRIPQNIEPPAHRACLIRGIRYHPNFAFELYGTAPDLDRAINARKIMSNEIPTMEGPDVMPYCIWHPEVATEETYWALAKRYPELRYNIGRACAVAGYADLYKELDLLPEVGIAEEARDNGVSDIFNAIMNASQKFKVMDDYTRTINMENPVEANLNCDTAVCSYLNCREYIGNYTGNLHPPIWDIAEDWKFDDAKQAEEQQQHFPTEVTPFLYTALPKDLPALNKDVLIFSAAYHGDFERYARLRRPKMLPTELSCVVRGIYHNTMFARWCSEQEDFKTNTDIVRATLARFIMNNDISRITDALEDCYLPYLIWFPNIPHHSTLRELVRRKPCMRPAAARTCIIANDTVTFKRLGPDVDEELLAEARASPNCYFLEYLKRKALVQGFVEDKYGPQCPWRLITIEKAYEVSYPYLLPNLSDIKSIGGWEGSWNYDNRYADFSNVNLYVSATEEMRNSGKDYLEFEYPLACEEDESENT
ncbi:hypothetical protein ABW19_dt0206503 [Dactylella cylindrospora]|nr:hypothetical protein ABW19_dt0206503 [Dactylella cylindrospora]